MNYDNRRQHVCGYGLKNPTERQEHGKWLQFQKQIVECVLNNLLEVKSFPATIFKTAIIKNNVNNLLITN